MAIQGLSIIFDDIPSESYGLYLMGFGEKKQESKSLGIDLDIVTEKLGLKSTPYLQGVNEPKELSFPMILSSTKPLDNYDVDNIQRWLFGQKKYKKLYIVQDDLRNIFFNCILNNPKTLEANSSVYGFEFTVVCDTSHAWQNGGTNNYSITSPQDILFVNESSLNDYMYPTIEFVCNKQGGSGFISIVNQSDDNREFKLTNMRYGEKFNFDSELEIATTSSTELITPRFNKKYLRMSPSFNKLIITGDISNIKLSYKNARRVSV